MMEEVNDDTNGESTFEFVDDKSNENVLKGDAVSSTTSASFQEYPSSVPTVASSSQMLPTSSTLFSSSASESFLPLAPVQSNMIPSQFLPTVPAAAPPIPMYNPNQQVGTSSVPYISPPMTPNQQVGTSSVPYISPPMTPTQLYQPISMVETPPPPRYALPGAPPTQGFIPSQTSPQSIYMSPTTNYVSSPGSVPQSTLELPLDDSYVSSSGQPFSEGGDKGVWGWIKGNDFLNKVAEKAKSSVDSVITTLDPGMKEIIYSGGDVDIIVASNNETKVSAIREAFQQVFGKATVQGVTAQASSIAPQPVGFSAGLKAAEERIGNLRQQGMIHEHQVIVAIENFLAELSPDKWFDLGCIVLQDPSAGIHLQIYTQAIPVSNHYVMQAKDRTPTDYPLGWSGFAITIGQILGPALGVHHSEWCQALTGVSRREILLLSAKTLAGMYKSQSKR